MSNFKIRLPWIVCCLIFIHQAGITQYIPDKPEPARFVNDLAKMLQPQEVILLEKKLQAYNDSTTTQIVIVIVKKLNWHNLEEYSHKLAQTWGIGQKDKDNGLLILISQDDRKIRIEVGYGLEHKITDAIAMQLIKIDLQPNFRKQQYYQGLNQCLDNTFGILKGEFRPAVFWSFWTSERLASYVIYFLMVWTSFYYTWLHKRKILVKPPMELSLSYRWLCVGIYIFYGLLMEFLSYVWQWKSIGLNNELKMQIVFVWLLGGGLVIFDFGYHFLEMIFNKKQKALYFRGLNFFLAFSIVALYVGVIIPVRLLFVIICGLCGWFLIQSLFSTSLLGIFVILIFTPLLYVLAWTLIWVGHSEGRGSSYKTYSSSNKSSSSSSWGYSGGSSYSDSSSSSFGGGSFGGGGASGGW